MAQVFPEYSNTLARASLVAVVLLITVGGGLAAALYRSSFVTQVGVAKAQPIPFSHQRHVAGNGLDCRFCHTSVEDSHFANIPPTQTCMSCHSQILPDSPMIAPVHESWETGKPIEWTRVNNVPDFVYFNHSIHVAKGIGCTTCHGPIDEMPLTWKAETFHMAWCLQCHRAPEKFIRPQEEVFSVDWEPPADQLEKGLELVQEYGIRTYQLQDCSVCHR